MRIKEVNAAFVHNPQAAGTSIVNALLTHFTGVPHKNAIARSLFKEKYELTTALLRHRPASKFNEDFKFAVVRDPFKRFCSLFRRGQEPNETVEEFLTVRSQRNHWKYAWHTEPQHYYIDEDIHLLRFESLEEDFNYIRERFNMNKQSLPHSNQNTKRTQLELSVRDISFIKEWYKEDYKLFGYNI